MTALVETVDVLARLTEESRAEMAARLVAAGVAHKGFMIPAAYSRSALIVPP